MSRNIPLIFHVIISGDTPPHSLWNETYESQLEYTESLAQAMQNKLSGRAIYPNIGNHGNDPGPVFPYKLQL